MSEANRPVTIVGRSRDGENGPFYGADARGQLPVSGYFRVFRENGTSPGSPNGPVVKDMDAAAATDPTENTRGPRKREEVARPTAILED